MLITLWIVIGIVTLAVTALMVYDRNPRPVEVENGSADLVMPSTKSRRGGPKLDANAPIKIRRRVSDDVLDPSGNMLRTVAVQLPCGAVQPAGSQVFKAAQMKAARRSVAQHA
jgi:hypothetical protein